MFFAVPSDVCLQPEFKLRSMENFMKEIVKPLIPEVPDENVLIMSSHLPPDHYIQSVLIYIIEAGINLFIPRS